MSRRFKLITVTAVAALIAAGCTEMTFNVTKETTGDVPGSGPFEVEITCELSGIPDPVSETLVFDGPNFPQTLPSDVYDVDPTAECLLAETESGGAETTTIKCVLPTPQGVTCSEGPDGLEVTANEADTLGDVTVEVVVTNDFGTTTTTAPTTTTTVDPNALAIVAEPAFTG